ncbi:MAG: low molecular weight phosphotyrosine protein phosphatase, partial [Dokdonella sp.]
MTRILFVCMGNICRSPIVESVARLEFARAGIDAEIASAGTENYHVGQRADERAIAIAEAHGYPLAAHRARQLQRADFER